MLAQNLSPMSMRSCATARRLSGTDLLGLLNCRPSIKAQNSSRNALHSFTIEGKLRSIAGGGDTVAALS